MAGKIIAIFVAPAKHAGQIEVEAAQLKAARGIVGDRFYGFRRTRPGRNLTLIESETIEAFGRAYRITLPLNVTRRNFITQGIRLNELVGKTFKIGDVLCRGFELCEPCKVMARQFPADYLSRHEVIRAFTGKGGIRAEVLTDGVVRLGNVIVSDSV